MPGPFADAMAPGGGRERARVPDLSPIAGEPRSLPARGTLIRFETVGVNNFRGSRRRQAFFFSHVRKKAMTVDSVILHRVKIK